MTQDTPETEAPTAAHASGQLPTDSGPPDQENNSWKTAISALREELHAELHTEFRAEQSVRKSARELEIDALKLALINNEKEVAEVQAKLNNLLSSQNQMQNTLHYHQKLFDKYNLGELSREVKMVIRRMPPRQRTQAAIQKEYNKMKDVLKTLMRKVLPALDAEILIYEMVVDTVKAQGPASGTAEDKEEDVAMDISGED